MNGRDLHVGDWSRGILPAMAPLGSPALTIAGIAMAFSMDKPTSRVAISFVGEGATSLGEWHERSTRARAQAAGSVLRAEQSDRAVDAGERELGGPRVRR